MKYCYNITFLVQGIKRRQQEEWVAQRVSHLRRSPRFSGTAASLARVIAVPGMSDYGREETSLTAQFEFDSAEAATQWGDAHFPVLAGAYSRAFGSEAYAMPSIIELKEV